MFDDIYTPDDEYSKETKKKNAVKAIIDDELDFPIIFEDDDEIEAFGIDLDDDLNIDELVDLIKELTEEIESELEEPWPGGVI